MDTLRECVNADYYRYTGISKHVTAWTALRCPYPGFRFTYFFRVASARSKYSPAGIFSRIMYRRFTVKYGFQIPLGTNIGKGLYIGHFGTVVVNGAAKLGANCNLAHTTTIGRVNAGQREGCPNIGSRVWIGTGAVVVGNITIGDRVLIAPNSYVNFDVASDSIVKGNPGAATPRADAVSGYVENTV